MKIILDSDIIIECLRGNSEIIDKIKLWHSKGVIISYTPVSLAEIHAGLRQTEEEAVRYFFHNLNLILIEEKIGIKAGEYLRRYSKSHNVEIADAFIAACTFVHKSELYTRNRKHYPMSDIKLI